MVEGPGCKCKGEKMKPKIKGQKVKKVSGDAVIQSIQRLKKKAGNDGSQPIWTPFHMLIDKQICDVQTLGKELFIFFESFEQCLRVHFLMSGGFRLNGEKIDHEGGGEGTSHTLLLELTTDKLAFNSSAADVRSAAECINKMAELRSLDICYEQFSHKRAVEVFITQRERLVCDVLLDQAVLPGVGNIIKNEAMFDSGIKPDSKVKDFTDKHISHLIKMTRDFSMIFYKCRRDGKPLSRHLKIYNKKSCKQCRGKVVTTRMGEDSARMTMFCPNCQNNDFTKWETKHLATKNSLLGWVNKSNNKCEPEWTCSICTLINAGSRTNCEACLSPRIGRSLDELNKPIVEVCNERTVNNTEMSECRTNTRKSDTLPQLPSLQVPAVSSQCKRKSDTEETLQTHGKKFCYGQTPDPITENYSDNHLVTSQKCSKGVFNNSSNSVEPNGPTVHRVHSGKQSDTKTIVQKGAKTSNNRTHKVEVKSSLPPPPVCPTHKGKCIMRQVHKKGDNLHRMFWSCPARGRCNYFKWADEDFPLCDGHGRRTVLRTVLKQGNNNGRKFYACSQSKAKQCQFFKWADSEIQMPIGSCER